MKNVENFRFHVFLPFIFLFLRQVLLISSKTNPILQLGLRSIIKLAKVIVVHVYFTHKAVSRISHVPRGPS